MSLIPQTYNNRFIGSTFNKHFNLLDYGQIATLSEVLNNPHIVEIFAGWFKDTTQAFLSLFAYPCILSPWITPGIANLRIGNISLSQTGHTVIGYYLNEYSSVVPMGTFIINRVSNDFMDFQEKIELYLPYANTVQLDAKDVMGFTIRIYMSIDFDTGRCIYYITRLKSGFSESVYMTTSGQLGYEIPIGKTNTQEVIKNNISGAISIVGGIASAVASEGALLPIATASIVKGAQMMVNTSFTVSKGSTQGGSYSFTAPNSLILYRRRSKVVNDPSDYVSFKGRPLRKYRELSTLSGFTKCADLHIENIGNALENEKKAIEELLLTGVIL